MMDILHTAIRFIHIGLGFVGLVVFWFPVIAKKGGKFHVSAGKVFVVCAYGVTVSAFFSSIYYLADLISHGVAVSDDPNYSFLVFLAYLSIVTFTSVRHGVVVSQTKKDRSKANTVFHRTLAWLSFLGSATVILFAVVFWNSLSIILLALSPIGLGNGRGILRYLSTRPMIRRAWFYEHMSAMIGSGIAFHTAFFVFGGRNLFGVHSTGIWGMVPWVLPAAIGIPASILWDRYYRKEFGDPKRSDQVPAIT